MKYYNHTQTRPVMMNGYKLLNGDEYFEDDEGKVTIKRNGEPLVIDGEEFEEQPEDIEPVEDEEEFTVGIGIDLDSMTKKELESYAQKVYGVDLDRRRSKSTMIDKIKELEDD